MTTITDPLGLDILRIIFQEAITETQEYGNAHKLCFNLFTLFLMLRDIEFMFQHISPVLLLLAEELHLIKHSLKVEYIFAHFRHLRLLPVTHESWSGHMHLEEMQGEVKYELFT